jgi:mono/diheme cytochrome c family protein
MRPPIFALVLTCASSFAAAADAPTLARGKEVFDHWCMPCHGVGDQYPGTVALGVKYQGAFPAALEARQDLAPEVVKAFVRSGISVMPFFRKTEIGDTDLDALAAYLSEPAAR